MRDFIKIKNSDTSILKYQNFLIIIQDVTPYFILFSSETVSL